jgi:hypothetical protein
MLTARRQDGQAGTGRPRVDWTSIPIHPFLVAAYPIVFLFAINADEQVTLNPIWAPLALALGITAVVLSVLAALVRDWRRAGLLTTVALIGFFGYGHAWNAASSILGSQWPLIAAWLLVVGIALFAAWRATPIIKPLTRGLNLVAALALIMNGGAMADSMVALGSVHAVSGTTSPVELSPPADEPLPDVYYVILDRYAGPTALEETFDFDNEPFLTALEERGFSVARHAHANYIKTPLSLGASLNLDFLDANALADEAVDDADREPIHRVLGNHLVVPTALKELGYRYLHLGNWWTPTISNVDADRVFHYQGQDEFATVLAQTTLIRAFSEPEAAPDDPWDWAVLRDHMHYAFDTLDEIVDSPGPKYVFAHLLAPHPPYLIDVDGSALEREDVAQLGDDASYVRYLQYTNGRMLDLVDRIRARSDHAIILIQSDEGPFPARYRDDEWRFEWQDATDAELEEKFGILFALRAPGADLEAAGFHDTISPVNAFRVIFNARYGTDLPLLPDRSWAHEDLYHFYDFFEITDRLDHG